MKWTGWTAVACAAMLTIGCAGDRDRDEDRSVMGSVDQHELSDDVRLDAPGSVGTSGQMPGHQAHGPDNAHDFMRKAAMRNNAEIELGRLAVERAQDQDVKQFAEMMIRDHTRANEELKKAVTDQSVEFGREVDPEHQQLMTRLRTLSGAEFDREYMRAMVEGHREARQMLEMHARHHESARTSPGAQPMPPASQDQTARGDQAAQRPGAPAGTTGVATGGSQLENAINQWASKTLPTVEQHLERAEQIHAKVGGGTGNH